MPINRPWRQAFDFVITLIVQCVFQHEFIVKKISVLKNKSYSINSTKLIQALIIIFKFYYTV
jgi:hypothetical protein